MSKTPSFFFRNKIHTGRMALLGHSAQTAQTAKMGRLGLLGQTASELAVFGAILLFVLGLLIRYAVSYNYAQNQQLAAMRLALKDSFLSGQGTNTSRNTASVLFIEDRLTTETGKFGATTRTPYIAAGSGTFTRSLFMATDWGYQDELPTTDMYINGKHFTFTGAGFREIVPPQAEGEDGKEEKNDAEIGTIHFDWIAQGGDCEIAEGCAVVYTRITKADPDEFDDNADKPWAFDLDRHGDPDVAANRRESFNWQWKAIPATTKFIDPSNGRNISVDVDGDLREEQVLKLEAAGRYIFSISDASAFRATTNECTLGNLKISKFYVVDMQAGDMDSTYDTFNARGFLTPHDRNLDDPPPPQPQPGLQDDAMLMSECSSDGGKTYLSIEQGKLYGDDRQIHRSVQRRNCIDTVERKIRLSNNTGRMCNCIDEDENGCDNPDVQICVDGDPDEGVASPCEDRAGDDPNFRKTCFDRVKKILYVRSIISNKKGRKWETDVSRDGRGILR